MMNSRFSWSFGALLTLSLYSSGVLADPTVFPTGVTVNEPGVQEGYVVYAAQNGNIYLVDVDGNQVHFWDPPCGWQGATRPIDNGHILLRSCSDAGQPAGDSAIASVFLPPNGPGAQLSRSALTGSAEAQAPDATLYHGSIGPNRALCQRQLQRLARRRAL